MGELLEMKISTESAEKQLDEYLSYFDLDMDELKSEQKDSAVKDNLDMSYGRLIKAIRQGRLQIKFDGGDDGDEAQLIQEVGRKNKTILTYKELTGAAKMSMKQVDANDNYGKMYSLVAFLTGESLLVIKKLKGRDCSLVESIGLILLQI